ncbi:MAG: DNA repair exonuclease [Lachnospiraceae bacterium]|nr:DNA repair exonuclease [Lachnospiraceae bacterium]
MKIFHCADLHLDAGADTRLGAARGQVRRDELLLTFQRLLHTADEEGADALLLCGDLFDRDHVSRTAAAVVRDAILSHPALKVYYLRGNHDRTSALAETELPNLFLFDGGWTSYTLASSPVPVILTGAEITPPPPGGTPSLWASLRLRPDAVNIVMLHGQILPGNTADGPEEIPLGALRGRNIDLLALGHIHKPQREALDARGTCIYAGCLEGRGFDECGPRGYWVHEISPETGGKLRSTFRPFASRTLYDLRVSADGCASSHAIAQRIRTALSEGDISTDDLVRIRLTGALPADGEKSTAYLQHQFEGLFFYLEILDETTLTVDFEDYLYDASFTGAFVRAVQARTDLQPQEKAAVIRLGLEALRGGG